MRYSALIAVLALLLAANQAIDAAGAPAFELALLASDNTLVTVRTDALNAPRSVKIADVDGPMIGIDVRPADGKLYGITQSGTLYTIDPPIGATTRVSRLSSAFRGAAASGFDFNPQSDRLRLVAASGQNLRVNVDVGAVAIDGVLTYAADDLHAGARPSIVAAGYTNSVRAARSTITFVIDHAFDTLVRQEPPNDGILITVGSLGVDCGVATGFDIFTDARGIDYAYLICGAELYTLDVKTGKATGIGKVPGATSEFISLTVLQPAK